MRPKVTIALTVGARIAPMIRYIRAQARGVDAAMIYLVSAIESTQVTLEVEADDPTEAEGRAFSGEYKGRDEWDCEVVQITGVDVAERQS
jgi:hypothetical protein